MRGHGEAHSAVSILNATATGVGCSLAIAGGVRATWEWQESGLQFAAPVAGLDDRLVRSVLAQVRPPRFEGAVVSTESRFPPSRGLKTSSSAAAALVQAAAQALGYQWKSSMVVEAAVASCRAAGITLTGALDDQVAVARGGCALVDNARGDLLRRFAVKPWPVAVWVPEASIPKANLRGLDLAPIVPELELLAETLDESNLGATMTANGRLFHKAYAAAGLPVNDAPVEVALAAGAQGAGLSGTGPAVAALFEHRVELPEVAGGTWVWSEVVP